MDILKNISVFDSGCEAVVIPMSTDCMMSDSFQGGMKEIKWEWAVRKYGKGRLGEVRMQVVDKGGVLKFIFYAFVEEKGKGCYAAICRVMRDIGRQARELKLKNVGYPMLGIGAEGLELSFCWNILVNSFYEIVGKEVGLVVCVPDMDVCRSLEKVKRWGSLPARRLVFEAERGRIMNSKAVRGLIKQDSFYYEDVRAKFEAFLRFEVDDLDFYWQLKGQLKDRGTSLGRFLLELDSKSKAFEFLTLCGDIVDFIYNNSSPFNLEEEASTRSTAMKSLYSTGHVVSLINYKEAGNDLSALKRVGTVRNALQFFLKPEQNLAFVSEKNRKQALGGIWEGVYAPSEIERIFEFFRNLKIKCCNSQNDGVLYSHIFSCPEIRPLWEEEAGRFKLAGKSSLGMREGGLMEETRSRRLAGDLIDRCLRTGEVRLDLGRCGVMDLDAFPKLFECVHLEELVLSNEWAEYDLKRNVWEKRMSGNFGERNFLKALPAGLGRLKKLRRLVCGGDWKDEDGWSRWQISKIGIVSKLENLEYVNLSNNSLEDLEGLEGLRKLKVVHLNNNFIDSVEALRGLKQLEEVYLSNNGIEDVSPFKGAGRVRTLDLHANRIRDLQPLERLVVRLGVGNTKWGLNTINVATNPLENPPMEVVVTGKEAVLQYFKDVKTEGTWVNRDVKVILVGNSGAGKTTLAKYLDEEKDLDKPHAATHWMKTLTVSSKREVSCLGGKCTIHLFDFGGHDFFHDTHHMFYSTNTLYVLLWDKDSNRLWRREAAPVEGQALVVKTWTQDYPLRYWLESVKHFIKDVEADNFDALVRKGESYNGAVLVVQNKVMDGGGVVFLNQEWFHRKYPFIFDFIHVSVKEKRNMECFDDLFCEMLEDTRMVGAVLPKYYQTVKEGIEEYDGEPIVSMEEFRVYCGRVLGKEISADQAKFLVSYLKQVGAILWFKDDKGDKVCVDKGWVIERIYKVLFGLPERLGEFDLKYVEASLEDLPGGKAYAGKLIEIMQGFKMIFQNPCTGKYIAPLYLPAMPARTVHLFLSGDLVPERRIEYSGFIHKFVILSFFQEYGALVLGEETKGSEGMYYYWKDGLIVKERESGEVVMIRFNLGEEEGNAFIDVFDVKLGKEGVFVQKVLADLREINKGYETEEMVTLDGREFVSLEVLRECAKGGQLVVTRQRRADQAGVRQEKQYRLKDYRMFLTGGIQKKKVVVSYSKKDLKHVHALERHLQPLVANGLIETPWCCERLVAAEKWDEEIQRRFEEADVVFFMISSFFYATPYIVDHEIRHTIDRYNKDKSVKIVPVVLEFYNWERPGAYNLKDFCALPFEAKPVSDYANPDIAWYMIGESVKRMLEKDLDCGDEKAISRELKEIYERQVAGKLDRNS